MSDEKELLDKIVNWLKDKKNSDSGVWGWVSGLLVTAVSMIVLGILYWKAYKQGQKLAKLLHERDVAEQEVVRNELIAVVENNEAKIAERSKKIDAIYNDIKVIDLRLGELENAKQTTTARIASLKGWDDIDSYLSSRQ